MAILLKNNSLFLHIPKTGGSWVTDVLKANDLIKYPVYRMHGDMDELYWFTMFHPIYKPSKLVQPILKDGSNFKSIVRNSYKFCFVRNPFSWYESFWKYQMTIGWQTWGQPIRGLRNWHPNALLNNIKDDDFNTFVTKVIELYPGYLTEMYNYYTQRHVDYVGKQENLAENLVEVLQKTGIKIDESLILNHQKVNVSKPKKGARLEWDSALKEEVYKTEYVAFKRYGYQLT